MHFSKKFKPGSAEWISCGFGDGSDIWLEGFVYIGKKNSDFNESLLSSFNETKESVNEALGSSLAVKPFKFSSALMDKLGDPYQVQFTAK